jgi:hypothetical protein
MEFTLMHKNVPVADIEIDTETGRISRIGDVFDARHLPVGVEITEGTPNRRSLNDWWLRRSIPASRDGLREALNNMGVSSPEFLIEKCYGLSLSDQYWFSPNGKGLKWEDVNFFQNDFSKDVGEILFGRELKNGEYISLMSPDNTSDGWLRKKWIAVGESRVLMKGGSGVFEQEPFNEVIASAIMKRLNVSHAEYMLTFEGERPYSLCGNFVTADTELIPAYSVFDLRKKSNSDSVPAHLLRCCDALGIPGVREAIDRLLTVDYIIANEDRHFNNFGFIRDANTLEWKGAAPVFDSGTSLWYNTDTRFVGNDTGCKPFRRRHEDQIKLVNDLSWYDYDALAGIGDECERILAKSANADEKRRKRIASLVGDRCELIARMC